MRLFMSNAVVVLLISALAFLDLIGYGIRQGVGQLKILRKAEPLEEVLKKDELPDDYRDKINWINEVKQFAYDSLKLDKTDNYTSFYDHGNDPILWVVTATPQFSLQPHRWKYPFLGSLPYKGHFKKKLAVREKRNLDTLGFDTRIGSVDAWSTLGWFSDPILSGMLQRDSAELAELIIHELTHSTIYLPSQGDFNENLATFIGRQGAMRVLASKGEKDLLKRYGQNLDDEVTLRLYLNRSAKELDSLYQNFDQNLSAKEKRTLKKQKIRSILDGLLQVQLKEKELNPSYFNSDRVNNAFFSTYLTYNAAQDSLQSDLDQNYGGNLVRYIDHFRDM